MRYVNADALKEKSWDADTRIGYVQVVDVGTINEIETEDVRDDTINPWRKNGVYLICPSCGQHKIVWSNYCPVCGNHCG